MDGTTAIKIDYYEELKRKADRLEELKLALISEHDAIIKKINKDGWNRYSEKMAYKDGLTFALDFINGNKV